MQVPKWLLRVINNCYGYGLARCQSTQQCLAPWNKETGFTPAASGKGTFCMTFVENEILLLNPPFRCAQLTAVTEGKVKGTQEHFDED